MKMWTLLLLVFGTLFTACSETPPISGTLTGLEERPPLVLYLVQPRTLDEIAASYVGLVLDSVEVQADGRFVFETLPDAPEPMLLELVLQAKGAKFPRKLEDEVPLTANYFPFVWQNGMQLELSADAAHFQSSLSILQPSAVNNAVLDLRNRRLAAFQQFLAGVDTAEHDAEQLLDEEAAHRRYQQAMMDFADQTEHLLPALVALRWVSPDNDFERVPEFLVSQCRQWQSRYPEHPWVQQLCAKTKELPVLVGDAMPEAMLPMLSGDTLTLSGLLGARLTIVDLWASWCAPCRKENRAVLVPLWDEYGDEGLQIIGYALDGSAAAWKGAIQKDGADRWLHASHLQGDDAPLLDLLRIQTIPANFLLDEEGMIIAKNLHGEELLQFVHSYFKP